MCIRQSHICQPCASLYSNQLYHRRPFLKCKKRTRKYYECSQFTLKYYSFNTSTILYVLNLLPHLSITTALFAASVNRMQTDTVTLLCKNGRVYTHCKIHSLYLLLSTFTPFNVHYLTYNYAVLKRRKNSNTAKFARD